MFSAYAVRCLATLASMPGFATRAVHADGAIEDGPDVAAPIRVSTTYREGGERRYRRSSHATTERLEAVLGSLEGGDAVCYASGMAAGAAVLDVVRPKRVSLPDDVYHGVRQLVEARAEAGSIEMCNPDDLDRGDVWWIESPSNPMCLVSDLAGIAREARDRGVVTVCDSTFATPVLSRPISYGIDVVMHSTTKSIAGHSDALGGVLIARSEAVAEDFRAMRNLTGAVPGSLDVWLALRGVRTMKLRVMYASASALTIARWFDGRGTTTWYPGLPDHPGHDIAAHQMEAFGSMLSIDLGDASTAGRFVTDLEVFTNATSLGGVESLAEHRIVSDPTADPGLVRLSVGVEDVEDLLTDLDQALPRPHAS